MNALYWTCLSHARLMRPLLGVLMLSVSYTASREPNTFSLLGRKACAACLLPVPPALATVVPVHCPAVLLALLTLLLEMLAAHLPKRVTRVLVRPARLSWICFDLPPQALFLLLVASRMLTAAGVAPSPALAVAAFTRTIDSPTLLVPRHLRLPVPFSMA